MAELQKSLFKASCLLGVSLVVLLLWLSFTAGASMAATEIPVGVILDLNSKLGYMLNNSLALGVEDYYSEHKDTATKIQLIVKHVSQDDVVTAAEEASNLIKEENVSTILGPQYSEQARYIVKLGEKNQVPVIWFPITGPSLLPPPCPYSHQDLNCYQFKAVAAIVKALGWDSIIPIYEDTEYGSHLIACLPNVLKDTGIRMANVIAIDSSSTELVISTTLNKLKKMRTHVFLVHMSLDLGTSFIFHAQKKGMMREGYGWILTQELSSLTDPQVEVIIKLYNGSTVNTVSHERFDLKGYMQGALAVKPTDSKLSKTFERRLIERNFSGRFNSSLSLYGWWAFHTIEALAKALEKPGTDNGTTLRTEILDINFTGKSGVRLDLSKGPLDQSILDVYNVLGQRERTIGSWSPKTGVVKSNSEVDETSDEFPLRWIMWPGYTLNKPAKLRIGVPITNSFPEFVNVYNSSKLQKIRGFAFNVFSKAVDALPFPLSSCEFVPLSNTNMTYDEILCSQTKVEDLDAIIGDITIVAHRTKCVDFTLPYLDSTVAMVVRVKSASTSKGILLKPFHWLLWLILGGIFVGATVIIIILERNKTSNEENKTSNKENDTNKRSKANEFLSNPFLVYKIDAMEFASSAAGLMVILTSFLFILVLQVYTANLTSILTRENIKEPSFNNETDIKNRNLSVGYQKGSWVRGLLIDQIGFKPSQLKALGSREEYNSSLSNGTEKGGVDAIFDETPYLGLFLSKYKSRFVMAGPTYKTGGFAFAFQKKSGLVSHFSKAILKVMTQDVELYRVLVAKSFLPTSIQDWEFVDLSDRETPSLSITHFGGLYPVLLSVVALFLVLSIHPVIKWLCGTSGIEWLREKRPFKLAKVC